MCLVLAGAGAALGGRTHAPPATGPPSRVSREAYDRSADDLSLLQQRVGFARLLQAEPARDGPLKVEATLCSDLEQIWHVHARSRAVASNERDASPHDVRDGHLVRVRARVGVGVGVRIGVRVKVRVGVGVRVGVRVRG